MHVPSHGLSDMSHSVNVAASLDVSHSSSYISSHLSAFVIPILAQCFVVPDHQVHRTSIDLDCELYNA